MMAEALIFKAIVATAEFDFSFWALFAPEQQLQLKSLSYCLLEHLFGRGLLLFKDI